jgi:hypothetical protein
VNGGSMTIGSFTMPVTGYRARPTLPKRFDWFGPEPAKGKPGAPPPAPAPPLPP